MDRERMVSEAGKQGPDSRWRPPLTIEAGPVREVWGIEGLRLWAYCLIDLEKGI